MTQFGSTPLISSGGVSVKDLLEADYHNSKDFDNQMDEDAFESPELKKSIIRKGMSLLPRKNDYKRWHPNDTYIRRKNNEEQKYSDNYEEEISLIGKSLLSEGK